MRGGDGAGIKMVIPSEAEVLMFPIQLWAININNWCTWLRYLFNPVHQQVTIVTSAITLPKTTSMYLCITCGFFQEVGTTTSRQRSHQCSWDSVWLSNGSFKEAPGISLSVSGTEIVPWLSPATAIFQHCQEDGCVCVREKEREREREREGGGKGRGHHWAFSSYTTIPRLLQKLILESSVIVLHDSYLASKLWSSFPHEHNSDWILERLYLRNGKRYDRVVWHGQTLAGRGESGQLLIPCSCKVEYNWSL